MTTAEYIVGQTIGAIFGILVFWFDCKLYEWVLKTSEHNKKEKDK